MEMAVAVQDFHSYSATATPYTSAPSSPVRFSIDPFDFRYNHTSAPTSPAAAGDTLLVEDNFAFFDFSLELEKCVPLQALTSADELFEQGKIRPLKPPPQLSLLFPSNQSATSIAKNSGTFAAAMTDDTVDRRRGWTSSPEFSPLISHSRNIKGESFRTPVSCPPSPIENVSCRCGSGGVERRRKWSFRNFLLFRSASEGRATGDRSKDPLQKFTVLSSSSSSSSLLSPKLKKELAGADDSRSSSFRSSDSSGSARRGAARGVASPHAMHYVANRAAAEEMKKKTALPYRQSFFDCLLFTPAIHSFTAKKFGDHFSSRGRF